MRTPKAMVVAGVMSGTSADGVDVALARVSPGGEGTPRIKVLGHRGFAYPRAVRTAVLRVMEGEAVSAGEMSRLNWRLGELYAECVVKTQDELGVKCGLAGLHGQTVYHQGRAEKFLGRPIRATWQMGEAAVVRERLGVPVVSDFRPADLAAGGQGAPLVPMLDFCMFRSARVGRVLLNLGGIANVTAMPAGAGLEAMLAFDTGPANMVVDGVMQREFGKAFDRGGRVAAKGRVLTAVLEKVLNEAYFKRVPPKSCGREQFGGGFVEHFSALCRAAGGDAADSVATATELTVATVVDAVMRFCLPRLPGAKVEVIAAGGGVRNTWMMRRLEERLGDDGVRVTTAGALGLDSQAKEAVAFALLAWLSWHRLAGNVPSATGAVAARVLGKISC